VRGRAAGNAPQAQPRVARIICKADPPSSARARRRCHEAARAKAVALKSLRRTVRSIQRAKSVQRAVHRAPLASGEPTTSTNRVTSTGAEMQRATSLGPSPARGALAPRPGLKGEALRAEQARSPEAGEHARRATPYARGNLSCPPRCVSVAHRPRTASPGACVRRTAASAGVPPQPINPAEVAVCHKSILEPPLFLA
jgi:hypothetical protein